MRVFEIAALLFRMLGPNRWKSPDPQVRLVGVLRLRDETKLAEIARADENALIRWAAVWGIEDRNLLAAIADDGPSEATRRAAAVKMKGTLDGPAFEDVVAAWNDLYERDDEDEFNVSAIDVEVIACDGKDIQVVPKKYVVRDHRVTLTSRLIGEFTLEFTKAGSKGTEYHFSTQQLMKIYTLPDDETD